LINSFGVFQSYFVEALRRPPADIAWIGSIQVFLLFFIGVFTGRLTDAGYFKQVFLLGSLLQVLGLFMASLSTQYWQIFLAQGVSAGLGNGCIFCPMLSLVSTYFSKKRNLAIGIAAAGSATGGLIFPAMVQQLLPRIGFGWTMRALGLVELVCLAIVSILSKQRLPPRRAGPIVEWSAFKEAPYALFAVGMFFVSKHLILQKIKFSNIFHKPLVLTPLRISGVCTSPSIT
jgi:MFS family permease